MNRLGITTPERGLVLEITIWNNSTESLPTYYSPYSNNYNLQITIEIASNDVQPPFNLIEQINIGNLYLPPNGSDIRFLKITDGAGVNLTIGSYSATLTYGDGMKIEPYPFDFRVMSEEGLQNAINQNPSGTIINIYFPQITIFSSGGITVLALAIGIRRKKKKD